MSSKWVWSPRVSWCGEEEEEEVCETLPNLCTVCSQCPEALWIHSVDTPGSNDLHQHWQAVLLSTPGEYVLIWTSPPTHVHVHCAHCVDDSTCTHGSIEIRACAETVLFLYKLLLRVSVYHAPTYTLPIHCIVLESLALTKSPSRAVAHTLSLCMYMYVYLVIGYGWIVACLTWWDCHPHLG